MPLAGCRGCVLSYTDLYRFQPTSQICASLHGLMLVDGRADANLSHCQTAQGLCANMLKTGCEPCLKANVACAVLCGSADSASHDLQQLWNAADVSICELFLSIDPLR